MAKFASGIRLQLSEYVRGLIADSPDMSSSDVVDVLLKSFEATAPRAEVVDGALASDLCDSEKCDARVWSGWNEDKGKMTGGWGSRCVRRKVGGGKFCTGCQKKADVTSEPCKFWEEGDTLPKGVKVGSKKGLHYGVWGEEAPIVAEGKIAIVWKSPELVKRIIGLMKDGMTYHAHTGEGKKGKTTPPRLPKAAKASSGGVKKKGNKRRKKAFHYWRKDNDGKVRAAIKEMCSRSGKFPDRTLSLLAEHNLDVDAAMQAYDAISVAAWKTFCEEHPSNDTAVKAGADELGNFTKQLTNGMMLGSTGKLCHLIWGGLAQSAKQPYEDAKSAADAVDDAADPSVGEKSKAAAAKKAKKKKAAVIPPPSDDEDSEEEDEAIEYELADGRMVYVDSEFNAYNEDCQEIGVVDPKTRTLI